MNNSFIATIAFAILAIGAAILANLVVLVFTASQWHVWGVLLGILAAGAAYASQMNFTSAAISFEAWQVSGVAQSLSSDFTAYTRGETVGRWLQFVSLGAVLASLICFRTGMA